MKLRIKQPGSAGNAYALIIFLVLMGLASAFLAANWATIRGLHREGKLLDRKQAAHWTNFPASKSTNGPIPVSSQVQ